MRPFDKWYESQPVMQWSRRRTAEEAWDAALKESAAPSGDKVASLGPVFDKWWDQHGRHRFQEWAHNEANRPGEAIADRAGAGAETGPADAAPTPRTDALLAMCQRESAEGGIVSNISPYIDQHVQDLIALARQLERELAEERAKATREDTLK